MWSSLDNLWHFTSSNFRFLKIKLGSSNPFQLQYCKQQAQSGKSGKFSNFEKKLKRFWKVKMLSKTHQKIMGKSANGFIYDHFHLTEILVYKKIKIYCLCIKYVFRAVKSVQILSKIQGKNSEQIATKQGKAKHKALAHNQSCIIIPLEFSQRKLACNVTSFSQRKRWSRKFKGKNIDIINSTINIDIVKTIEKL